MVRFHKQDEPLPHEEEPGYDQTFDSFPEGPLRLQLYYAWGSLSGSFRTRVAYRLTHGENEVFYGDDYFPSPMIACDGEESAAELLVFLSLYPGDGSGVGDYHFRDYTPEQIEWATQYGEELSLLAHDLEDAIQEG